MLETASDWFARVPKATPTTQEVQKVNFLNAIGVMHILQKVRHEDPDLWTPDQEAKLLDVDELSWRAQEWLKAKNLL